MQNVVPLNEGEVDVTQDPETQLQEQEKRIEISCALAAEASRRGRMLSGKVPVQGRLGSGAMQPQRNKRLFLPLQVLHLSVGYISHGRNELQMTT